MKKERLQRLNRAIEMHSRKSHENLRGQIVEVLVEGESKNNASVLAGRTRTNKLVHFEGGPELIGSFVHVKITDAMTWYIKGEIVPHTNAAPALTR